MLYPNYELSANCRFCEFYYYDVDFGIEYCMNHDKCKNQIEIAED